MKNKKNDFVLLTRKMKEQNLDFEVVRDLVIGMKYTNQNFLKKL